VSYLLTLLALSCLLALLYCNPFIRCVFARLIAVLWYAVR